MRSDASQIGRRCRYPTGFIAIVGAHQPVVHSAVRELHRRGESDPSSPGTFLVATVKQSSSGWLAIRRDVHRRQHEGAGGRPSARFPGAVALLTSGYSVGQILGPVAATPLLRQGLSHALLAGGAGRPAVGDRRRCASVRIHVGRCGSAAGSHIPSSATSSGASRVN